MKSFVVKFFAVIPSLLMCLQAHGSTHHAGATIGQFDVDPSGSADYSINISIPPGINGMQPELGIFYNSNGGNGLLGVGWNLAGISSIDRCPTNHAEDGFLDHVDFDANDQYCLNGQRLIEVSPNEFRTKDESYSKIIATGQEGLGPKSFIVYRKDGKTIEYGATANARYELQSRRDIYLWSINKITDRAGNYISYKYFKDKINGHQRIDRIEYTANSSAALSPAFTIEFGYQSRPDPLIRYMAGDVLTLPVRMNSIRSKSSTGLVREYKLQYELGSTGKSRVISISECDGEASQNCKQSTSIAWTNGVPSIASSQTDTGVSNAGYINKPMVIDVNGDGKSDLVEQLSGTWWIRLSNGVGFNAGINTGISNQYYQYSHAIDYNGDGRQDIIYPTGGVWKVLQSTGNNFQLISTGVNNQGYQNLPHVLDLNGDGLDDMAVPYNGRWYIRFNRGGSFGPDIDTGISNTNYQYARQIDYDGDGMMDLIYPQSVWKILRSTGSGFEVISTGISNIGYQYNPQVVDVNGDGLHDLLLAYNSKWNLRLNTGNGFGAEIKSSFNNDNYNHARPFDFDSNGSTEIMVPVGGTWQFIKYNGISLELVNSNVTNVGWNTYTSSGDFNGDSLSDLIHAFNSRWQIRFHNGGMPDLANSISNGFGERFDITYKPLTDVSVYTKHENYSAEPYPLLSIQSPLYVVSEYEKSTGLSAPNDKYRHIYAYEGMKTHVRGYGSLGFSKIIMSDPQTGIESATNYQQYDTANADMDDWYRYATRGRVHDVTSKLGAILLSYKKHDWLAKQSPIFGASVGIVELESLYEESYGLNDGVNNPITKKTTSNSFDVYGNPLTIVMDSHDGYIKTSTNTYYFPDTSAWEVGRVKTSVVLSQSPSGQSQINSTSFTYYPNGLLESETVEPSDQKFKQTTSYLYDVYGNKNSATVTANAGAANVDYSSFSSFSFNTATSFNYVGLASPTEHLFPYYKVTTSNSKGLSETVTFDARFGEKVKLVGPNGVSTTWDYDSLGRKIRENRADDSYTQIDYLVCELDESCSDPTMNSLASPLKVQRIESTGSIATLYFDALGREILKSSSSFDGREVYVKTEYNNYGQVSRISNPYFDLPQYWNYSKFDVLGRLIKETPDAVSESNPFNGYTEITYNGLTTTTKVHIYAYQGGEVRSQSSTKVKNTQGKLIKAFDDSGNFNEYQYDAVGNLRFIWDSARNETETHYDIMGRKIYMRDPDMGVWTYRYDALGKMRWQQDAKGQIVKMDYDELGRLITRMEPEGTSTWIYDTAQNGLGKLHKNIGINGYQKVIAYDNLSRVTSTTTTIDGSVFYISSEYRPNSSLTEFVHYPNGFSVFNNYNNYGHLDRVFRVGKLTPLWEALVVNERGQVVKEQLGNGLSTIRLYDDSTGRLEGISTGDSSQIQYLTYQFDSAGNLSQRRDEKQNLTENFTYDNLSRLNTSTLTTQIGVLPTVNYHYDSLGNIKEKSDTGLFQYGQYGAGPHAVTTAGSSTYNYDANGNMQSGDGRTITYTSFNKPSLIEKGATANYYEYDPTHKRIKKTSVGAGEVTASSQVFYDDFSDSSLARWSQLRNGRLQAVTDPVDGKIVRKTSNNDPNGGSAQLDRAISDFDVVLYTRRLNSNGGALNRYSITDSAGNGYGVYLAFNNSTLNIERRTSWGGTRLNRASVNVVSPNGNAGVVNGQWYTIKLKKEGGTLTATAYIGKGQSQNIIATVTTSDTTFNNFDLVNINGGYDFDTDNLSVYDLNPPVTATNNTTYYVNKSFEEIRKGSVVEHKYYIAAGGTTVLYKEETGVFSAQYLHKDHIGSTDAISDELGNLVECTSFGAWGARRLCDWTVSSTPVLSATSRGFTGHNMDDGIGLIDMNARIYDPKLGRFLQPDIYIQYPETTQGFNRYTYVNNNPLSFTDPSGRSLKKLYKKARKFVKRDLVKVTVTYALAGWPGVILYSKPVKKLFLNNQWAQMVGYTIAGSLGNSLGTATFSAYLADISGGSFEDIAKSFAISFISAKMSQSVNKAYGKNYTFNRVLAESSASGVTSVMNGGKFSDGFKSAFTTSFLNYAAMNMRSAMIKQSKIDPLNASGKSVGLNGDNFKLGGGRFDFENFLAYFEGGPESGSPLGGWQGGKGRFLGMEYEMGDWQDYVIEAYAGPHDFLNSGYWYNSAGNIRQMSQSAQFLGQVLNYVNVIPATVFVAASVVHPYMNAIDQSKYGRHNKL